MFFINKLPIWIVFTGLASASPLSLFGRDIKQMSKASSKVVGAAYFLTNEPDGNFVVSAAIGADGKLTLRQAVGTDGLGAHGLDDIKAPDPLFSQGSIKASAAGNLVAAVNAGSHTLSVFSVDRSDPTKLRMIGRPVGSGGEFPVAVAVNGAGNSVCAVNGGEINGVSCFKVDQSRGLVPISGSNRSLGLNQTTPATGPAGSVSHIIFSEDNTKLVVSVKGVPPQPGFLAVWDVNADGSLSQNFKNVAPGQGGLLPFSMSVIPGKNAILATDAGVGFDIFDFAGNSGSGNVTNAGGSSVVPIDGQKATCWSAFSSKAGNFFLTDIGTATVTEVKVDDNLKGSIVKQYPQGAGTATIDLDVASIGGKDFVYVLLANATAINVLSVEGPGQATSIQKVDIARPARSVGLKISSSNLQGMTTFVKK